MYNKILVPLDRSKISESVLPYARSFARLMDLPVELLYVNDINEFPPDASPLRGNEYLENIASSFPGNRYIQLTVELGKPAEVIVGLSSRLPGTLVAMATHGHSGAKRWLLGSVAEKVLHTVKNHLLLVPPVETDHSGEAQFTGVIVPLDGSAAAEKALPTAAQLASALSLDVILVRVVKKYCPSPLEAAKPGFDASTTHLTELWSTARLEAELYLAERIDRLRNQGITKVCTLVLPGGRDGAAAEIIDLAQRTANNFIAMSTHGESGVGSWLMGSVTARVAHHSKAPVLIIPTPI